MINNGSGKITGEFTNGDKYSTTGDGSTGVSEADRELLDEHDVQYEFEAPSNNWLLGILSIFLPVAADHRVLHLDAAACVRARWAT